MKKVLFIDRDGTLIVEPKTDFQIDSLEKLEFLPGVFQNLAKIAKELDYILVMVTNQDGLGTSSFPMETFLPAHEKMIKALENENIFFDDIYIDSSFEKEGLATRKPGVGMLGKYVYGNFDLENSYVIGDRMTDVQLAENLGTKAILIGEEPTDRAELTSLSWWEIYSFLKAKPRKEKISRTTKETDINIEVNLDGSARIP